MRIEKVERNGIPCAVVRGDAPVITDADSALDVLMAAKYEAGTVCLGRWRGSGRKRQGRDADLLPVGGNEFVRSANRDLWIAQYR